MVTANKYDQTKANREGNPNLFSSAVSADRAEDWLTAYQIERRRITFEREIELIEEERKENRSFADDLLSDPVNTLREKAEEKLQEKLRDKLEDRLPWIKPFAWVLEKAQENQLRVQDAIAPKIAADSCGISIDAGFAKFNFIDENCKPPGAKPELPEPPPTSTNPRDTGQWRAFATGQKGKTITLAWNYTGWCYSVAIKPNASSGLWTLTELNAPSLVGTTINNIYRFAGGNPDFGPSFIDGASTVRPNGTIRRTGRWAIQQDGRFASGFNQTFPSPSYGNAPYSNDDYDNNTGSPDGWHRTAYRSVGRLISWSRFNTGFSVQPFFLMEINCRVDITIGELDSWNIDWGAASLEDNNVNFLFFFEGVADYGHGGRATVREPIIQTSQQVFCRYLAQPEVINWDRKPKEPRIKPPPPPPKDKCECMANCCPQNQQDLSEIKRLLRVISDKQKEQDKKIGLDKLPLEIAGSNAIYKKLGAVAKDNPVTNFLFNNWLTQQVLSAVGVFPNIKLNSLLEAIQFGGGGGTADTTALEKVLGKPKEVALWDTDFTKKGSQVEKKTPKDVFDHLALLTDRVEIALKIIGIHDLPITVDKSRSKYDNLAKLFTTSPSSAMIEMGKNLLQVDRKQITSVFQLLNWVGDTVDEKLGHWESEVSFKDVDLLKENNQEMKLVHGNMQHALHDITKFSGNAGIHAEANTWLLSDVLMEMAVLKKEIMGQTYTMQALVDYLGFAHGEEKVDIPIPVTFDPQLLKDKNLAKFLEDSTTPIQRLVVTSKEKSLSQRLTEIENTLGILRAVNLFPVKGVADIKALLELLNKDKDWEKFIKTMNQFSEENELQLELKTIKKDDSTK